LAAPWIYDIIARGLVGRSGVTIISAVMLGHYGGVGHWTSASHMQRVAAVDPFRTRRGRKGSEVASLAEGLENSMLGSIAHRRTRGGGRIAERKPATGRLKTTRKWSRSGMPVVAMNFGLRPLSVIDGRPALGKNRGPRPAPAEQLGMIYASTGLAV